ncbi:protein kinase domain-containing protein [Aureliella helgolandensis]|uniref:Serine/threonine-protein kinase PknB n=1 Tax=Aureliella helgolandensis TaxID=2527968 RepID=A0A518GB02_9BACT|nr:protein kinase [Aureliella helgolandensis]QDV25788.1 Serine/threonine-protein kinase PknB [Aureliella helgolandensis]
MHSDDDQKLANANETAERIIDSIIDDFVEQVLANGRPDIEDACARYPEYADRIRSAAASLELLADNHGGLDGPSASDGLRNKISSELRRQNAPQLDPTLKSGQEPSIAYAKVRIPGERYRIREILGEGGFGVVYVAEQIEPVRRKVAIKVVKPGMGSKEVLARFEAERQALAMMDHPNVAKVLDGGATEDGRPYFVMELIRGIPITTFCTSQRMPMASRLKIFRDTCMAVQHAHIKGIIHRDIKPSNVLVTIRDDQPIAKVIDFGVAKALHSQLTDATIYTAFGQMIGTPLYMSPEQIQLSEQDVDTRSDIYSLGVLLYELLTGETPFTRETLAEKGIQEFRALVCESEPPRPSFRVSTLRASDDPTVVDQRRYETRELKLISGELDWVVLKALAKDRRRRYQFASEFAEDIDRFLAGSSVLACPPTLRYRMSKAIRRHRIAFAMTAAALMALLTISIGAVVFAFGQKKLASERMEFLVVKEQQRLDANQLADDAKNRMEKANVRLAQALVEQASARQEAGAVGYRETVDPLLKEAMAVDGNEEIRLRVRGILMEGMGDPLGNQLLSLEPEEVPEYHAENPTSPRKGKRYFTSSVHQPDRLSSDYDINVFEQADPAPSLIGNLDLRVSTPDQIAFSTNQKYIGAAGYDGFAVWSLPDCTTQVRIGGNRYSHIHFHPKLPMFVATQYGKGVELWSIEDCKRIASLSVSQIRHGYFDESGKRVICVQYSDAKRSGDQKLRREVLAWSFGVTPEKLTLAGTASGVADMRWSRDDQTLQIASEDEQLLTLDTESGELKSDSVKTGAVKRIAVSGDGRLTVLHSLGESYVLNQDREKISQFYTNYSAFAAAFTPDDSQLVAAGWGYSPGVWENSGLLQTYSVSRDAEGLRIMPNDVFRVAARRVAGLVIHPSGTEAAILCWDKPRPSATIFRWTLGESRLTKISTARYGYPSLEFIDGGEELVFLDANADLAVMDWPTGKVLRRTRLDTIRRTSPELTSDGMLSVSTKRMLACVHTETDRLSLVDLESGRVQYSLPREQSTVTRACFSGDGKRLAVALSNGQTNIWNLEAIESRLKQFGVWGLDETSGWQEASLLQAESESNGAQNVAGSTVQMKRLNAQADLVHAIRNASKGDTANAKSYWQKSRAPDPNGLEDPVLRARMLMTLCVYLGIAGDPETAHEVIQEAVRLDTGLPGVRAAEAQVLHHLGRHKAAVEAYRQAIKLDVPGSDVNHVPATTFLGLAKILWYFLPNDAIDEAEVIDLLERSIERDPGRFEAHQHLARVLSNARREDLRDPEKALQLARTALQAYSGNVDAYLLATLGMAQYRNGNFEDAIATVTKALEAKGDAQAPLKLFIAMAHWQLGNREESVANLADSMEQENLPNFEHVVSEAQQLIDAN